MLFLSDTTPKLGPFSGCPPFGSWILPLGNSCCSEESWAVLQEEGLESLVDLRHSWANARDRRWELRGNMVEVLNGVHDHHH